MADYDFLTPAYFQTEGKNSPHAQLLASQLPSIMAGQEVLPDLVEGATIGGLLQGPQGIGVLEADRVAAAADYMSQAGINRNGLADYAGKLTATQKLDIGDELNRRRQGIAGIGFTGTGINNSAAGMASSIANSRSALEAQKRAANSQNLVNGLGAITGLVGTGINQGWFSGSPNTANIGASVSGYTGPAMANWVAGQ